MRTPPLRRLLLFLTVLLLPTLAIVVQGWMIATRDREIAERRSRERVGDIRRRLAAEVGQDVFALLERIKGQEVANAAGLVIPQPGTYSDPAVVLIGRIDGGKRIIWPWEAYSFADAHRERMRDRPFAQMVEEARRAEVAKDYRLAVSLYTELANGVRTGGQLSYARLGLARALQHTGASAEATALYRRVLRAPSSVVDEDSVSFASLAAAELTKMGVASTEVLARVQTDLESRAALRPTQTSRWRSVLEALQASDGGKVRERATALLEQLLKRARDVEIARNLPEVQRLQQDFSTLSVTATNWQPYVGSNKELWLVGRAAGRSSVWAGGRIGPDGPQFPEDPIARGPIFSPDGRFLLYSLGESVLPLVIVVRAEAIRESVESSRTSDGAPQRFTLRVDGDGELLGERLPGLRITFPDLEAEATSLSLQRSFYGWALLFVIPLTFVGGYLVWRDTRREVHLADMRSQFVSSVSHELKTPLTSIRMFAEALQMKYSDDPQLHQEYLDTIVKESERLTRLLNNVLDFSRIDRGQKSYQMESTRLADLVGSAARTMQYPLEQQGFVLDLRVDDQLPPVVVDRDAIQQAILNLLVNAMKYSGKQRKIELQLLAEDGAAVIVVTDYGIGIPVEEQRRIFEAFYRSPIPENLAIAGTGLGLALVAHVAAAHGGSVHVQSRPGEGSRFSLRLPLSRGGAA